MIEMKKKQISKDKLLLKLLSYCAYQDRCLYEVSQKIHNYDISPDEEQEIVDQLIQEKYLDETRYAKSVARGKFNYKKWGRNKIRAYLASKRIDITDIHLALNEINEQAYLIACIDLVEAKIEKLAPKDLNEFERKQKVIASLSQKGYEFDVIERALKELA